MENKVKPGFMAAFMCAVILLAGGCHWPKPRPLTFEEQQAYMAKQQCAQEASAMNPDWPCSDNPNWDSYFVMCMNSLGIPDSVLYRMWY